MNPSKRQRRLSLPVMSDLMLASWETVARRNWLIARGKCSTAEYRRMVREKWQAAAASGVRFVACGDKASMASILAPWYRRAAADAKRPRKK